MQASKFEDVPQYPHAISMAINAVIFLSDFNIFTKSVRNVLVEIVKRLDLDGISAPIWFKRANAASSQNISLRTVYTALAALEKAGYIVRHPQPICSNGYYGCARIRITKALAELLGFPWPESSEAEKHENDFSHQPSANATARTIFYSNSFNKKQPQERDSFHEIEEEVKKSLPKPPTPSLFQRDHALRKLLVLGLSKSAVYSLMGLCKKAGQRLSEVVEYIGARLDQIGSSSGVYAYLRACITSGQDFTYKNQRKQEEAETADQKKDEAKAFSDGLAEFRKKYAGKYFKGLKSGKIWKIDSSGCGVNVTTGAYMSEYDIFKGWKIGEVAPCDPPSEGDMAGSDSLEQGSALIKFFQNKVSGRSTSVEPPQKPQEPPKSLKSTLSGLLKTKKQDEWEARAC